MVFKASGPIASAIYLVVSFWFPLVFHNDQIVFQVVKHAGGGRGVELKRRQALKKSKVRLVRFIELEVWTDEGGGRGSGMK